MKWNWWALSIVACMVGVVLAGCATTDRAAATRTVKGGNEYCEWEFDLGKHGKVKDESLKLKQLKGCTEHKWEPVGTKKLYIGDGSKQWEVDDLPFVEFLLKGTCRRCWPNTLGGMTCIEYPGNC